MNKSKSDKIVLNGIHIVNIVPVEVMQKRWLCVAFEDENDFMGDEMHFALLYKNDIVSAVNLVDYIRQMFKGSRPLLRMHSECLLGDALFSNLCDCGEQLEAAFKSIIEQGQGIVLYLRQEGRGIGMRAKLDCLAAQEGYISGVRKIARMTPDEANLFYGFKVDERDYSVVPRVLKALEINEVDMMTGNIDKIDAIRASGIAVSNLCDISREHICKDSRKYLELLEKASRNYNYILEGDML